MLLFPCFRPTIIFKVGPLLTLFWHPLPTPLLTRHLKNYVNRHLGVSEILGPTSTQNLVVKFNGGICGGILVEHASDYFFCGKEARKSSSKLRRKFATSFAETFANFTLEVAGA